MASNPLFIMPDFFFAFSNRKMATFGLKEMGKFLWEGREKGLPCWLSQFSKKFLWEGREKSQMNLAMATLGLGKFLWEGLAKLN